MPSAITSFPFLAADARRLKLVRVAGFESATCGFQGRLAITLPNSRAAGQANLFPLPGICSKSAGADFENLDKICQPFIIRGCRDTQQKYNEGGKNNPAGQTGQHKKHCVQCVINLPHFALLKAGGCGSAAHNRHATFRRRQLLLPPRPWRQSPWPLILPRSPWPR